MAEQLRRHLSFEINFVNLSVWDRFQLIRPEIDDLLNNKKDHWLSKEVHARIATDPKNDPWNDGNKTRSLNFASEILKGWATGPIIDSYEGEMKKGGSLARSPGDYKDQNPGQIRAFRLGATNEQIHPTVEYRMEQLGSKYKPKALEGFNRKPRKDSTGKVTYEWVKGDIRIPEYKISPEMSNEQTGSFKDDTLDQFERSCAVSPSAQAFLGQLDKEYGFDSWAARSLDAPVESSQENYTQTGFQPNNSFPDEIHGA